MANAYDPLDGLPLCKADIRRLAEFFKSNGDSRQEVITMMTNTPAARRRSGSLSDGIMVGIINEVFGPDR